jgi:hypothetical protein
MSAGLIGVEELLARRRSREVQDADQFLRVT